MQRVRTCRRTRASQLTRRTFGLKAAGILESWAAAVCDAPVAPVAAGMFAVLLAGTEPDCPMTESITTDLGAGLVALAKRIELWPIDRLRPYERNPRTHSEAQVDQIA